MEMPSLCTPDMLALKACGPFCTVSCSWATSSERQLCIGLVFVNSSSLFLLPVPGALIRAQFSIKGFLGEPVTSHPSYKYRPSSLCLYNHSIAVWHIFVTRGLQYLGFYFAILFEMEMAQFLNMMAIS